MESVSFISHSKSTGPTENKLYELTDKSFKKITCVAERILIDFEKSPFCGEPISSIFFKTAERFFVVHKSAKISFWTRREDSVKLEAFEKLQSGYYQGKPGEFYNYTDTYNDDILIRYHKGENSFIFFDVKELILFFSTNACQNTHFLLYVAANETFSDEEDSSDVKIEKKPHRIYISEKDGSLHRGNLRTLDQEPDPDAFRVKLAPPLYIDSMTFCHERIVAACNSYDEKNPFSCIQWFSEKGKLSEKAFESKHLISSFTLIKNDKEKKIFIVYKPNILFMHNFEDKNSLSTVFTFFKEDRFTISLIGSYLFAYQPDTSNTQVFVLFSENLNPLYQLDLKGLLGQNTSILSLNEGRNQSFILTDETKVLECFMAIQPANQKGSQEDEYKLKRKRKESQL